MSLPVPQSLPPTISPVFDAKNRWAGLYVSLGAATKLETGLLSQLCGTPDSASAPGAKLPLLIALDEPDQLEAGAFDALPEVPCYLVLSDSILAADDAHGYLIPLADRGVKLMAPGAPPIAFAETVESLAYPYGSSAATGSEALLRKLPGPHLATGVDSYATHRQCLNAGFGWFSGDWALHPEEEPHGSQATTSRSTLLNLLGLVVGDADSHEIEVLLKRDPNLSYQLLKLVNSVSFSLSHKISSFGQAITLLGRRQLQRWLQLLIYAGHHSDGSVDPLLGVAAMRAALMEALAEAGGGKQDDKDRAYMVGMFSLLDVLFKAPIETLVVPLNLADDITAALIEHKGTLGALLEVVVSNNTKPCSLLGQRLAELNISASDFVAAQLRANAWAAQICREI